MKIKILSILALVFITSSSLILYSPQSNASFTMMKMCLHNGIGYAFLENNMSCDFINNQVKAIHVDMGLGLEYMKIHSPDCILTEQLGSIGD